MKKIIGVLSIIVGVAIFLLYPSSPEVLEESLTVMAEENMVREEAIKTTIEEIDEVNTLGGWLSPVLGEENLGYDKEYETSYLKKYNYFREYTFKQVWDKQNLYFTTGNKINEFSGVQILGSPRFMFHVTYCNEILGECSFRINGVPTGLLGPESEFPLTDEFSFRIKEIEVNKCDNHRFCNLGFEGYHVVKAEVKKDE